MASCDWSKAEVMEDENTELYLTLARQITIGFLVGSRGIEDEARRDVVGDGIPIQLLLEVVLDKRVPQTPHRQRIQPLQ